MRFLFHLLLILIGLPLLANADALDLQLQSIRELGRFRPETALGELQQLVPAMEKATLAEKVDFYAERALAQMRLGKKEVARQLADQLVELAREGNNRDALAKAYLTRGIVLRSLNEIASARAMAKAADALTARSDNPRIRIQSRLSTSWAQSSEGDFAASLSTLQDALSAARTLNDPPLLSSVLDSLTALYHRTKEFDKGFAANAETYAIAVAMESPGRMAQARLSEYGLAIDSNQPERGRLALLNALTLAEKIGARRMITNTLVSLSDSYLKAGDFARTQQFGKKALDSARLTRDEAGEATAMLNIGMAYLGQGKIATGITHCEAGIRYYEKRDSKPTLQEVLVEYGSALERAGQFEAAVAAYHRERSLMDDLFQIRRQKAVLDVEEKYEAQNKQRQIASLQRENRLKNIELANRNLQQKLWGLLSAVVIMALVILGLVYRKTRGHNRQLERNNSALKYDNARDPLTGLYNRRHFHNVLHGYEVAAQGDRRADAQPVGALFVLDLDHFKRLNDAYGHAAGDLVLQTISVRLQEILRETDMIFRWGGEEFLAFLPKLPHQEMEEVARRLLRGIAATEIAFQNQSINVKLSIGFAPFPLRLVDETLSLERVIHLADMALYIAKSQGRNRGCGLTGLAQVAPAMLDAVERDLDEAWREGLVDLHIVVGPE